MATATKYTTAMQLSGALPGWVTDKLDQERLASYDIYDDMYHNNPDTFVAMLRGTDDLPILVPTAKSVIKTMGRYVGRGFGFTVKKTKGTPEQQLAAMDWYGSLYTREEILSKFARGRKELLRRGDLFWYLSADTAKPEGTRISVNTVDPRSVFWILQDDDPDIKLGVMIVETFMSGDKVAIKRQRWLKPGHPEHPSFGNNEAPIAYDAVQLEADKWDTDEAKVIQMTRPLELLPPLITKLPIYHMKNDAEDDTAYGSSELRGIERVIAAINQGVSDEDLTLAMGGLGMYKSNSGGPVGDDGSADSDWIIGPGRVIEDSSFERVNGVQSIEPSLNHIKYLSGEIDAVAGITDVTRGEVTAQVAESGVALAIRMAPTVDMAEEKDIHIKDVFDHLLYDLKAWFKTFEGVDFADVEIVTAFGDKMPRNRDAEVKEMLSLKEAGLLPTAVCVQILQDKYGYVLPDNVLALLEEDTAKAAKAADPYGADQAALADTGEGTTEDLEPIE